MNTFLPLVNNSKKLAFLNVKYYWYYRAWISGQNGRIRTQNLAIPPKRILRAGHSCTVKFLLLWNKTSHFRKKCCFSCNSGQFISVWANFLLLIRGDSFLNAVQFENSELNQEIWRISWNITFCQSSAK